MTNQLLRIELEQRLNKLSSSDYVNLECWMLAAAFNKAMDAWVSRQLEGINQTKSTAEGSIRSIDKLQIILQDSPLVMNKNDEYWEASLPDDYVEWSRLSANAVANCCPPRKLKIFLGEQADLDIALLDKNRQPSFEWAETLATVMSGTVRIYTNNCFDINEPVITYYRRARHVKFANCADPDTGEYNEVDVECEFPTNMTETIIDEAAAILANDMDSYQKQSDLISGAERSN
jgi:hypothetical protein